MSKIRESIEAARSAAVEGPSRLRKRIDTAARIDEQHDKLKFAAQTDAMAQSMMGTNPGNVDKIIQTITQAKPTTGGKKTRRQQRKQRKTQRQKQRQYKKQSKNNYK